MKLRRHPVFCLVAAVALLILALPAAALGAETGAESGGPTEPATPETTPPPSTGWVPQGTGTGSAGGGDTPIQRGSSLGSGGRPSQPDTTVESPSYGGGSDGYYESESESSPSTSSEEESTVTPEEESEIAPVEQPAAPKLAPIRGGTAPVVGATAVKRPEMLRVAGAHSESPATAASVTTQGDGGSTGALWWVALIIACLIMIYAAARLLLEPTELKTRR